MSSNPPIRRVGGTAPQSGGLGRPPQETLGDLLERVLDKGIVVAGDIVVNLLDIELLTLKVRLLICSVDTAQEIGIDWWKSDPFLSSDARRSQDHSLEEENRDLRQRLERLEARLDGTREAADGNALEGHREAPEVKREAVESTRDGG